jgi:hypothetical protein
MNTCSTCKNNISTYSDIYRCFDLDFCSIDCRDKTLKLVLKKDPNLNNPYYWSDFLNIKKENNVNNFNLYNTRNTFNKKNNVGHFNLKHFNENEFKRNHYSNNFTVNQTYINIDLPDVYKDRPERKCNKNYKLLFITTLTLLILINISFYIHISI